jgi:methyl-accepting chemotaxis protein
LLCKKPEQRFADGEALERALAREIVAHDDKPGAKRGLALRFKLPLTLAVVTAAALLACTTTTLARERRTLEQMAITSGGSIASFVTNNAAVVAAENAGLGANEQDWSALQAFATTAARDPEIRDLIVADTSGVIRAAGDPRLVGRRYRPTAGEAVMPSGGASTVSAAADAGKGAGIRFVHPILYAGARFGTVDLVVRRAGLDAAIDGARASLMLLSLVVMLAVLLVGYLSGAMVARPLARLRKALDEAAGAAFALRISHRRGDEFGAAFDAFNRAAAAIEPRLAGDDAGEQAVLATRVTPVKRAA